MMTRLFTDNRFFKPNPISGHLVFALLAMLIAVLPLEAQTPIVLRDSAGSATHHTFDTKTVTLKTIAGNLNIDTGLITSIQSIEGDGERLRVNLSSGERWMVGRETILTALLGNEAPQPVEWEFIQSIAFPEARATIRYRDYHYRILFNDGSMVIVDPDLMRIPIVTHHDAIELPLGSITALRLTVLPGSESPESALIRLKSEHTYRVEWAPGRLEVQAESLTGHPVTLRFHTITGILPFATMRDYESQSDESLFLVKTKDSESKHATIPLQLWAFVSTYGKVRIASPFITTIAPLPDQPDRLQVTTAFGETFTANPLFSDITTISDDNGQPSAPTRTIALTDLVLLTSSPSSSQPLPLNTSVITLINGERLAVNPSEDIYLKVEDHGEHFRVDSASRLQRKNSESFILTTVLDDATQWIGYPTSDHLRVHLMLSGESLTIPWNDVESIHHPRDITSKPSEDLLFSDNDLNGDSKQDLKPKIEETGKPRGKRWLSWFKRDKDPTESEPYEDSKQETEPHEELIETESEETEIEETEEQQGKRWLSWFKRDKDPAESEPYEDSKQDREPQEELIETESEETEIEETEEQQGKRWLRWFKRDKDPTEELSIKIPFINTSVEISTNAIVAVRQVPGIRNQEIILKDGSVLIADSSRRGIRRALRLWTDVHEPETGIPSYPTLPDSENMVSIRLQNGDVLRGTLLESIMDTNPEISTSHIIDMLRDQNDTWLVRTEQGTFAGVELTSRRAALTFQPSFTSDILDIPIRKLDAMTTGMRPLPPPILPKPRFSPLISDEILIQGGSFQQGSSESGIMDETPAFEASVSSFYIDATEITRSQFAAFIGETGYRTTAEEAMSTLHWANPGFPQFPDDPVVYVSWIDAARFCNWRSRQAGLKPVYTFARNGSVITDRSSSGYRLPTESEREFAAGASKGLVFPWGNQTSFQGEKGKAIPANFRQRADQASDGFEWTNPVKHFPPNHKGLFGMAGNVWEWCEDWYHERAYEFHRTRSPHNPVLTLEAFPSLTHRSMRGGSFRNSLDMLRIASRGHGIPTAYSAHVGFRTVRNSEFMPSDVKE